MTDTLPTSPKLRLLRVFNVLAAVFSYCHSNFRRLFVFAWFACALYSLSLLLVECLVYALPHEWPAWLLSREFNPPTWLTPFATSPWDAMAWFFVLLAMSDPNSRRGVVNTSSRSLTWIRFELNAAIWIAAAMLVAITLFSGFTKFAQTQILIALGTQRSVTLFDFLYIISEIIRLAVMAVVYAWCLPLIGQILRTGAFHFERTQHAMRGNRLRLVALFLLLSVALWLIFLAVGQVTGPIIQALSNTQTWNLRVAALSAVVNFPIQMLFIVVPAVMVGVVLNALDERPNQTAEAQPEA